MAVLAVCVGSFGQAGDAPKPGVLTREQAAAILPPSVFYRGQSATIQARNSGGVKLPDGKLVLAAVVDTGGYSTSVQQTYQAYLLTEVPLVIGGNVLAPGAYGFGFVAGDKLVVMDMGANEVLTAATVKDTTLMRPNPLHFAADESVPGQYRLYMGRSYVAFATK